MSSLEWWSLYIFLLFFCISLDVVQTRQARNQGELNWRKMVISSHRLKKKKVFRRLHCISRSSLGSQDKKIAWGYFILQNHQRGHTAHLCPWKFSNPIPNLLIAGIEWGHSKMKMQHTNQKWIQPSRYKKHRIMPPWHLKPKVEKWKKATVFLHHDFFLKTLSNTFFERQLLYKRHVN